MKAQIIAPGEGFHNEGLEAARERLLAADTYADLSTICIIPTRGGLSLAPRVVQSWFGMMPPMNQKFIRLFASGMEVAEAYNQTIQQILDNPELKQWKYILTLEDDVMPPPDGIMKLYESAKAHPEYAVIGGLYWTKGEGGQPMIYGDPKMMPKNFIPQIPEVGKVQECNGMGMGFHLFRLEMFRDERIPKPWFRTLQEWIPGVGARTYTQDLYFYENAAKAGYRFACDTRVKCGHYDWQGDMVW